jgi:hypothetical protein
MKQQLAISSWQKLFTTETRRTRRNEKEALWLSTSRERSNLNRKLWLIANC